MEAVVDLLINGFKQQNEEHYRSLKTAVLALVKAGGAASGATGGGGASVQDKLQSLQIQIDALVTNRREEDVYLEELEAELDSKNALIRQLQEETKVVEEFRPRTTAKPAVGPVKVAEELLPSQPLQGLQVSTEKVDTKKVTDYFKKTDAIVAEKVKVVNVQESSNEVVDTEETEEVEVEEEVEVVESEVEESEEEAEAEEVSLTEFEYRGATYYRDDENKVYMPDEDGEVGQPIGIWNEAKQKILKLPAAA